MAVAQPILFFLQVVINSNILKETAYTRASETFHQWADNRLVYGLNFASKEEAESFGASFEQTLQRLKSGQGGKTILSHHMNVVCTFLLLSNELSFLDDIFSCGTSTTTTSGCTSTTSYTSSCTSTASGTSTTSGTSATSCTSATK